MNDSSANRSAARANVPVLLPIRGSRKLQHWLLMAMFLTAALIMAGCASDPAATPQPTATAPVAVASTPTPTLTPTPKPTPTPTSTPTPTPKPPPNVQITEFPMLRDSAGCSPYTLAVGKDGNIWFLVLCGSDANVSLKLGRITPAGKITEFPFPQIGYTLEPQWLLTVGPDGNLWSGGSLRTGGSEIVRITSAGKITEFPVPTPNDAPPGTFSLGLMVAGPDGNLWFTERCWGEPDPPDGPKPCTENHLGRITPTGAITQFPLPALTGIAAGRDGNIWVTQYDGSIGRITPAGKITEFPLPDVSIWATGITDGPDGNLWFTQGDKLGHITPTGKITEVSIPGDPVGDTGFTSGHDGSLWFIKGAKAGRITSSGKIITYALPKDVRAVIGMAAGRDGNLWFSACTTTTCPEEGQIVRITPSGKITEFPVPASSRLPSHLIAGPDENLWYTEANDSKLGRITPQE